MPSQLGPGTRWAPAALLAEAWRKGAADGVQLLAAEETARRRSARANVLAKERGVLEELRRRAGESVHHLLQDEGLRGHLATALRDELGEAARVSETAAGGLLAQAPDGRSIDASAGALVGTSLGDLDLEPLWTARRAGPASCG